MCSCTLSSTAPFLPLHCLIIPNDLRLEVFVVRMMHVRTVTVRKFGFVLAFRFMGLSALSGLSDVSVAPSQTCLVSFFVPSLTCLLGCSLVGLLAFSVTSYQAAAEERFIDRRRLWLLVGPVLSVLGLLGLS